MDLKRKLPDNSRVIAVYNRGELDGIMLGVYWDDMMASWVGILGYDSKKKKKVLLVDSNVLKAENIELIVEE